MDSRELSVKNARPLPPYLDVFNKKFGIPFEAKYAGDGLIEMLRNFFNPVSRGCVEVFSQTEKHEPRADGVLHPVIRSLNAIPKVSSTVGDKKTCKDKDGVRLVSQSEKQKLFFDAESIEVAFPTV